MPPPEKSKKEKKKENRGGNQDKSASSGTSRGDKKSKSDHNRQSVSELKKEENDEFIQACVKSHSGWLTIPLTNISNSISVPIPYLSLLLLILLMFILLLSPATWIPHISAPIALFIPLQNTLQVIAYEKRHRRSGTAGDSIAIQWIIFWSGWIIIGWIGEGVKIFRPAWRGIFELSKVGSGIILGGPWFSKLAMIPGKPNSKLAEAENREGAERKAREGKEASAKARGKTDEEKSKQKAKQKAEAKAKEKAKAEAKAKAKAKANS